MEPDSEEHWRGSWMGRAGACGSAEVPGGKHLWLREEDLCVSPGHCPVSLCYPDYLHG